MPLHPPMTAEEIDEWSQSAGVGTLIKVVYDKDQRYKGNLAILEGDTPSWMVKHQTSRGDTLTLDLHKVYSMAVARLSEERAKDDVKPKRTKPSIGTVGQAAAGTAGSRQPPRKATRTETLQEDADQSDDDAADDNADPVRRSTRTTNDTASPAVATPAGGSDLTAVGVLQAVLTQQATMQMQMMKFMMTSSKSNSTTDDVSMGVIQAETRNDQTRAVLAAETKYECEFYVLAPNLYTVVELADDMTKFFSPPHMLYEITKSEASRIPIADIERSIATRSEKLLSDAEAKFKELNKPAQQSQRNTAAPRTVDLHALKATLRTFKIVLKRYVTALTTYAKDTDTDEPETKGDWADILEDAMLAFQAYRNATEGYGQGGKWVAYHWDTMYNKPTYNVNILASSKAVVGKAA